MDRHLPGIRADLEQQRQFRLEQLAELAADAPDRAGTADSLVEISRILRTAAASALGDIDAALQRLEHDRYGSCEVCAEPIPVERLRVLPMSRLCARCQFDAEFGSAAQL